MKQLFVLFSVLFIALSLSAQDEYEKRTFVSSQGDSLLYRLLRPETEVAGEKYPLVLFLHGAGERGNDNEKQLTHGGQMFLNPVNREKYPAFVLSPQCPSEGYWGYSGRPDFSNPELMPIDEEASALLLSVKEMLDTYIALPQVDETRVYVMGLSMGGMATFDMACRFPETFAAAVPICGAIHPARLPQAKGVNFRIFHGDSDAVVPVECSRVAYKALKAVGANVEYIEFPGRNHDSWTPAFNYPGFMDWLFGQKKSYLRVVTNKVWHPSPESNFVFSQVTLPNPH